MINANDINAGFLTGSRAYGTPKPDSDIDIVVLVHESSDVLDRLRQVADDSDFELNALKSGGQNFRREGRDSLRFGKLNLLVMTDPREFCAWQKATNNLIVRAPVTRQDAIDEIDRCLAEAGVSR